MCDIASARVCFFCNYHLEVLRNEAILLVHQTGTWSEFNFDCDTDSSERNKPDTVIFLQVFFFVTALEFLQKFGYA